MKGKALGFIVFEFADEFEQALTLEVGDLRPPGGVLSWRGTRDSASVFPDRVSARKAITRTEHYRLAFGTNLPERKNCKIVPVASVPA